MRTLEIRRHSMRLKPGQHLSQAGVDLARLVGMRAGPFDRVITSPVPRAFETALAMGFAVDEQMEEFGLMPKEVGAEVPWPADFAVWADAAWKGGATTRYVQALAAIYHSIAGRLPDGGAALIIHHGGIVEASAVACLPDADFTTWGPFSRPCEGVRLEYEGGRFTNGRPLRVQYAPEA